MAEEQAKNRKALKSRKLGTCGQAIREAIDQASDTSPTEKSLTRLVTHLQEAWDEFETAMLQLMEVGSEEHQESYQRSFVRVHKEFEEVRQLAETLM